MSDIPHDEFDTHDEIPIDAFALATTPFDYIVVGSGAGGGPLAARLALGGMRVLVLEAGGDLGAPQPTKDVENEHAIYHCPGLHTASTEPDVHIPPPPGATPCIYSVRHYTDDQRQNADTKSRPYPDVESEERRQFYPRARCIGGCTAHYAMIAIAPPDDDWQHIADLTADTTWHPDLMRLLFSRLERFTRGKHFTPLGVWWDRILDKWNPDRHLAGRRGSRGWLDISFTDPQLALGDSRLTNIIKRAAVTGQPGGFATIWRWIKRFVQGRFYQDLDLNDARTMSSAPEGMALLPLAVSSGIGSRWSPQSGTRRGPREFLYETRDILRQNRDDSKAPSRMGLVGYLYIVPNAPVERIIFHAGANQGDPPRAVGVKLRDSASAARNGNQYCYARREIVICGGAFESPKLLMLSGIGDEKQLAESKISGLRDENDDVVASTVNLPGVGRNLGDRYEISVISRMNQDWASLEGARFTLDERDVALTRWKESRQGIYATNGGVVALLHKSRMRREEERPTTYDDRKSQASKTLAPDLFLMGFPAAFRGYYPGWSKDLLNDDPQAPYDQRIEQRNLWSWTILKAWSRNAGEVRLNPENPTGAPEINFHYFERQDSTGKWHFNRCDPDLLAIAEAVAVARRVNREANSLMDDRNADKAEIQPGFAYPDESESLTDWIAAQAWGHHACGTCRIGQDSWQQNPTQLHDPDAVLDSKFRVHGVVNLRVVDASVFPKIPGYFLAVPTFMIAEKAADTLLAEQVGLPRKLRGLEAAAIRDRRQRAANTNSPASAWPTTPPATDSDPYALPPQTVGLALSGGGIRSATFCLGILQALAEKGRLRDIDFISTASGGGYIGAFLGGLFQRTPPTRPDPVGDVEQRLKDSRSPSIRWLRTHASYLVSDGTSDWWQLIAVYWRNLATLYVVIVAVGLAVFGTLRLISDCIPTAQWLEQLGVSAPATGGVFSQTLYAISPWWVLVVALMLLFVLPASMAYWLSPHPGGLGYVSFFAFLFWIVLCIGFIAGIVLPGGFWLGNGALVVAGVGMIWLLLFRFQPPSGSNPEAPTQTQPFYGRMMRNRTTRLMSGSLMWLAVAVGWTAIDTLARLIAEGRLTGLLAGWAILIAPWLPFIRHLSVPTKKLFNNTAGEKGEKPPADRFPRLAMLLAFLLLGFLIVAIDAAVQRIFHHNWYWGFYATLLGLSLSMAVAQAIEFLNGSTLLNIYTARLSRTFLGATSISRLVALSLNSLGNILRYHPTDDIRFDEYCPHEVGGPVHLIGVCVNETVDVASQREIADRRALPMCVWPFGVSVGTRFYASWEDSNGDIAPFWIRFRKWLNGNDAEQVRVLKSIPNVGDPFHVLGDKLERPAFVELLTLGQWIAVSGAAFGTGLGRRNTKSASILAGLSNARLGYWWDSGLASRDRVGVASGTLLHQVLRWPFRFFRMQNLLYSEWMGKFAGPSQRYWNLSDGGHFDNTAAYELIRRRVPLIFAVDGSADPEIRFDDIADLMRHVRTDFGAEIEFLNLGPGALLPANLPAWTAAWFRRAAIDSLDHLTASECHAALAQITWSDSDQIAWLVYIKASVCGDESADVVNYRRSRPAFPSEPTTDQFFNESQWESYRKLGMHVGNKVFWP